MKLLITIFLLSIFSSSYSNEGYYKTYINEKYGVSFQYPASTLINDLSHDGEINILFNYKNSPFAGILFSIITEEFKALVEIERMIKEENENEYTENEYKISGSVIGLEFIREIKSASSKGHYYLFPSLKEKATLSFRYTQDTNSNSKIDLEQSEKLLSDYRNMIETVKLTQ